MHNLDPNLLLEKVNSAEQGELCAEAAAKAQPAGGILQIGTEELHEVAEKAMH
jgi:hypothetical protein